MRNSRRTIALASAFAATALAVTALYADTRDKSGHGGMMGPMMQMMNHCSRMMQGMVGSPGSGRPNEQWQKQEPHRGGEKELSR